MKNVKAINAMVIALFLMIGLASFTSADNQKVTIKDLKSDWTLVKTVDGVEFHAMLTECHDEHNGLHHQVAYFKLKNTNAYDVNVKMNRKTWIGAQVAQKGTSEETGVTLSLAANSEVEGECGDTKKLNLFVKDLTHAHVPVTTHFVFTGISVVKK